MRREFSVYLDAVRFLAASTVLAAHLTFPEFTGGRFAYQGKLAGEAVAAFFVLSGYVIAYVASERERTLQAFAVSRLARVYSVALPAILLAIGVDLLALHFHWPRHVPIYQYRSFPKYLILALTFSGQAGPLDESTFGSHTFWSLDYEVWYYCMFAAACYGGKYIRWPILSVLLLLSGPRILILFPMWLLGVGIYRLHRQLRSPPKFVYQGFFLALAALILFRLFALDARLDDGINQLLGGMPQRTLGNSREFASDSVAACFTGASIFFAYYMELRLFAAKPVASAVTYLASFTFVLYLTQRSFLDLYAYGSKYDPHSPMQNLALLVSTLISVWLLGLVTEHRKHWLRGIFRALLIPTPRQGRDATAAANSD